MEKSRRNACLQVQKRELSAVMAAEIAIGCNNPDRKGK